MTDPARTDQDSSPLLDRSISAAADRLLLSGTELQPVGGRPFLARAQVDDQSVRLRRWPDGADRRRVEYIERLHYLLSESEPRIARPYRPRDGRTGVVPIDDVLVDVQTWLPSRPAAEHRLVQCSDGHTLHAPAPLSFERTSALVTLIAGVHDRSAALAVDQLSPVASVAGLLKSVAQDWRLARVALRPIAATHPPVQRWLRLGEQVLPAAERAILEADLQSKQPVVAHLRLWPAHVLVDRAAVAGLLDFSGALVTTPLLDVAHLVVHFSGWSKEHAEHVLGAYLDCRTLSPDERRTLAAVAAVETVIDAARLLRLGHASELSPASSQASTARAGALAMLDSLEALISAVIPKKRPVPRAKRRAIERRTARTDRSSR